jgi:putative ABC transport system permease protein
MLATESLLADLRLAFRLSTKHILLKLTVVATLALGIGANTAMFTLLDALLFHNLPYPNVNELIILQVPLKSGQILEATSYPRFQDWARETRSFQGVAAESTQSMILSGQGEAEPLTAELTNAEYFSVLRINTAMGRTFTRDETAVAGAGPVAIISDGLWRRQFASDVNIVGKAMHLNGRSFTVIGVFPPGMRGISQKAEVWVPITMIGSVSTAQLLENQIATWVTVIARLKPGVSREAAQQEVNAISTRLPGDAPQNNGGAVQVTLLQSRNMQRYRDQVFILVGAVGFVLMIACLNVANLLLSYFSDRKSELALRHALGASRFRLLRQLLLESVVLSGLGGMVGLFLALTSLRWLRISVNSMFSGIGPLQIDSRVFLFAAAVSLLSGIVAGALPFSQVTTRNLADNLKSQARVGTSFARARLRMILVIGQISLAVVLVVGAGLMVRSMLNLRKVDLGFNPDHVLAVKLAALPAQQYDNKEKVVTFYDSLLAQLSRLPQVHAVAIVSSVPLVGPSPAIPFLIQGRSDFSPSHPPTTHYLVASQGYFSAMSMPLLQGRGFERSDSSATPPVAVINESMARQYWPGQSPIGGYVNIFDGGETPREVVGEVANVKDSSLDTTSVPEVYLPYQQIPSGFVSILRSFPPSVIAKTDADPQALAGSIRSVVNQIEPNEAVLDASTMRSIVSESVAEPRLYGELLFLFALLALALAAIGVYGVVSYSVEQRRQELSVRIALGASRARIRMLILNQGMIFTLVGMLLGLAGAWALGRLLQAQLFELQPNDPVTFALAVLALWIVAMAASYLPARRASLVDPGIALREQ